MLGHCLCGAVRFEVRKAATPIGMCHCSKCRRVSGVASNAEFMVAKDDLAWSAGEDQVSHFVLRDGWSTAFCNVCGSPLPKLHPGGGAWWVPAGLIEEPTELRVEGHIFVGSKAPWDKIAGDAPRFDADFDSPRRDPETTALRGLDAEQARAFAGKWLPAWSGNRPELLASFYTSDAVYSDPVVRDGVRGREAVLGYFTRLLAKNPDWVWTHRGSIPMADGFLNLWHASIPAGGRVVEADGVCTVQLRDGRIYANHVFFDRSELIAALG